MKTRCAEPDRKKAEEQTDRHLNINSSYFISQLNSKHSVHTHKHAIHSYFTEIKHASLTRIIMYKSTEMHCLFLITSPRFSMAYNIN